MSPISCLTQWASQKKGNQPRKRMNLNQARLEKQLNNNLNKMN